MANAPQHKADKKKTSGETLASIIQVERIIFLF